MERKVIWSPEALGDLEQIRDYIGRDSLHYAFTIVDDILSSSKTLDRFSKRGRIVPELQEENIREIFVKRYRLIYEISEHRVDILTALHMSRDFMTAWSERIAE